MGVPQVLEGKLVLCGPSRHAGEMNTVFLNNKMLFNMETVYDKNVFLDRFHIFLDRFHF